MKHIVPLLLVSLCLVACEQKEKKQQFMSVANKTFYHQITSTIYYRFTTDSVFHTLDNSTYKGTYIQYDDVVKMKMVGITGYVYGFVKNEFFIEHDVYTLDKPTDFVP